MIDALYRLSRYTARASCRLYGLRIASDDQRARAVAMLVGRAFVTSFRGRFRMKRVSFVQMKDGTEADYLLLQELEHAHLAGTAERLIEELRRQGEESLPGYRITRLEHALQTATRALRDNADEDWVVSALLHDIGDGLAPQNHDRFAAEILRPYVRAECTWVVEHHGAFQMYYYAHHYGWNRHEREKYADSPHFATCAGFCERWDQSSFDPDYKSESLDAFVPMIERVFSRKAFSDSVVLPEVQAGLPPAVPLRATHGSG